MTWVHAKRALTPNGWVSNAGIRIDDGRIGAIEPVSADLAGDIVLPGLCNAHSHAFQRALAGHAEQRSSGEDSFWTWRTLMYELAGKTTPERLQAIASQLYADMLVGGYTTVAEFHYLFGDAGPDPIPDEFLDALMAAADDTGIRLVYVPVLYERADFDAPLGAAQLRFGLSIDGYLDHCDRARRRLGERHGLGVGAHSLRAVTEASLKVIDRYSASEGLPMHIHIAEQPREVSDCEQAMGARPVAWLLDNLPVDARWTLVHATHINPDEVAGLAGSAAVTCLCPGTEANLADGLFPLQDYLSGGGRISVGSDSHVTVDPFAELRWLEYGQRLIHGERNIAAIGDAHTGAGLFRRAWQGGEQSAGRPAAGLTIGAAADLVVLDATDPLFAGHDEDSLLDALVFAAGKAPIKSVFVAGRNCLRDGRHVNQARYAERYQRVVEAINLREVLRP